MSSRVLIRSFSVEEKLLCSWYLSEELREAKFAVGPALAGLVGISAMLQINQLLSGWLPKC